MWVIYGSLVETVSYLHLPWSCFMQKLQQVTAVEFSIIFSQTPPYGFSFQSSVLLLLSGFCRHPNHNNIMKDLV